MSMRPSRITTSTEKLDRAAEIREGEEAVDKLRAGQPSIFEKVRQRFAADAKDDTLPPG